MKLSSFRPTNQRKARHGRARRQGQGQLGGAELSLANQLPQKEGWPSRSGMGARTCRVVVGGIALQWVGGPVGLAM